MISGVGRVGLVLVGALVVGGCQSGEEPRRAVGTPVRTPAETVKSERPLPKVRVPDGVRAGFVVYDRSEGKYVRRHGAHRTFRSASVVKILIVLDYLHGREKVPKRDLRLLRPMLRSSDDGAATVFWKRGGQGAIIKRMVRRMGLDDTAPPPKDKPGFWGYVAISASDIAKTYRYVLERAPKEHREFIMGQLRKATECGTDGYDQSFGIPSAVERPRAVKQGWSGFGTVPDRPCEPDGTRPASGPFLGLGRPVLHTTGVVGDRIIVLLTLHPAGSSFERAAKRTTALAREVART